MPLARPKTIQRPTMMSWPHLLCFSAVLLLLHASRVLAAAPRPLRGDENAVSALIDRVLSAPGASQDFNLQITDEGEECAPGIAPPCFSLADAHGDDGSVDGERIIVKGTTASELTAGLGFYFRHYCNMTIGWPRGGGSNVFVPTKWPSIGSRPFAKRRNTPYSYLMNVCTHSYSLVWYDWNDWQRFIDWMALSGINLMLAMTGQEYVQYKVFRKLGLEDEDIRNWFNGPALLTWSRGQNEYGSGILGPLPRSWMVDQWHLQRKILPRLRSLGIIGQLPGFQGNVPVQLKSLYNDTNITEADGTGWMDSLDPFFGRIADLWMETLIDDFGTDHWYQLDGYFDGGTAPWLGSKGDTSKFASKADKEMLGRKYDNIARDEMAYRRATAAYRGLNRTDPDAIWSFQGWAIIGWDSSEEAATLKGFVDSTPRDKFVIIDMAPHGEGEWRQFNSSSFYSASFVWTALHNFGGTDGLKGDLSKLNRIPFDAPSNANVIGTGATPEGIDQNTVYYEFIFEQPFRDKPVTDLFGYAVARSFKRYNLAVRNEDVARAWTLLAKSAYATDLGVQDGSGVTHLPAPTKSYWAKSPWFEDDRYTPKPVLCHIFEAWGNLIHATEGSSLPAFQTEPFTYDLVNVGREILANIATPASLNFSDAFSKPVMDKGELMTTGSYYIELLHDIDTLVGTDFAFLLGPWIHSARRLGTGRNDCVSSVLNGGNCERFLEWNARTQITTWKPTTKDDTAIPQGPIDYAAKHWQGLIKDYYAKRASLTLRQALQDQEAGRALNESAINLLRASLAYNFTTAENKYPMSPVANAAAISRVMYDKYAHWFEPCKAYIDFGNSITTYAW